MAPPAERNRRMTNLKKEKAGHQAQPFLYYLHPACAQRAIKFSINEFTSLVLELCPYGTTQSSCPRHQNGGRKEPIITSRFLYQVIETGFQHQRHTGSVLTSA